MKTRLVFVLTLILVLYACAPAGGVAPPPEGSVYVHTIDVGQGSAVLIETMGGNMLIDAGEPHMGAFVVYYLQSQGIMHLDYIVATHPHNDHIGGMPQVMSAFSVGTIIMPDAVHDTMAFENLLDSIESYNIPVWVPSLGDAFWLGDAEFTVLAPVYDHYSSLNDMSIVLRMQHGHNGFLFMGDAEEISERDILRTWSYIGAHVLKLGHHGSRTSTSQAFLDAVNPMVAIISCGVNNQFGHPHPEVLQALYERDIMVFRTDESGTIIVHSYDGMLEIIEEF